MSLCVCVCMCVLKYATILLLIENISWQCSTGRKSHHQQSAPAMLFSYVSVSCCPPSLTSAFCLGAPWKAAVFFHLLCPSTDTGELLDSHVHVYYPDSISALISALLHFDFESPQAWRETHFLIPLPASCSHQVFGLLHECLRLLFLISRHLASSSEPAADAQQPWDHWLVQFTSELPPGQLPIFLVFFS